MKKAIQAAVIASLFTSVAAFAHHPAEAINTSDAGPVQPLHARHH